MLIIRLNRTGKKNASSFRIVLIEKTAAPKSGKFLEILGNYNPRLKEIGLKQERIKYWISKGVQTSETVHNLLVSQGVINGPKIKKKIKIKKKEVKQDVENSSDSIKPEEKQESKQEKIKEEK
ncbi:MAG: 30S ribosomal protein S16 [bacterium]